MTRLYLHCSRCGVLSARRSLKTWKKAFAERAHGHNQRGLCGCGVWGVGLDWTREGAVMVVGGREVTARTASAPARLASCCRPARDATKSLPVLRSLLTVIRTCRQLVLISTHRHADTWTLFLVHASRRFLNHEFGRRAPEALDSSTFRSLLSRTSKPRAYTQSLFLWYLWLRCDGSS